MTKFIFTLLFFITSLFAQNNILVSTDETYGDILTDGAGNTLYFFTLDAFDKSVCNGGCADAWPIFYVEDLQLGEGLNAEDFGVTTRDDESLQTTYKGWPLYYFVSDNAPGETNGEGVNNVWYVAKPDYSIMLVDNQLLGNDGVEYTSNYEAGQEVTQYFVDAYGRTLYTFIVDAYNNNNFTAEDFSNNGAWPVYEEEAGSVPSALDSELFGAIDVFGHTQITYNGWPLYYFGADSMIRGNNKGVSVPAPGVWPVAVADEPMAPKEILVSNDETYGDILTDGAGNTLYFFTKDAFDKSVCNGGCADAWPIFYAEDLKLSEGLNAEDFGVTTRDDESLQTTYKGWPLYYFVSDNAPGETNGEGVNNVWYVAKPDYSIMLVNNQLLGNDGVEYTSNYEAGQEETQYFVDAYGRTLYTFIVDAYNNNNFTAEDFSNNGAWPVYEEEAGSVPSALDSELFGAIDVFGHTQITYNGWPLYYFGADSMIRGNNKGVSVPAPGVWPVAVADEPMAPKEILVSNDETYGDILTDGAGNTLYFFTKDAFDKSVCNGGCADAWPIFYAEDLKLGEGLNAEDFGVTTRDDESLQTTYKGWPLYYFVSDNAPGETNGEGVNNVWYVAKPDYSIMLVNNQLLGNDGVEYTSNYEAGQEETQYFVDAYGRTLYTFIVDTYNDNNFTAEDFSNNSVWPVYEEEAGSVPSALDSELFGAIDVFGHTQITYNGWPLYYFGSDSMIRGNNKGVSVPAPGVWPVAVADVGVPTAIVQENENIIPKQYKLDQNFPNPFNPSTLIKYSLPVSGNVKLVIYDLTGRVIQNLVNKVQPAGEYSVLFDANSLSSGVYFYSITVGNFIQNRRMTLIR